MADPRILITGTGGPSGISILKDLEGEAYELFSGDIDPYATGLYLVDETHRMLLPRGDDPAFADPTKFVGKVYDEAEAKAEARDKGWVVKPDGAKWRRVVPSPLPKRIFQLRPIRWLLEKGTVVIAAGGGGIPTMYEKGADRKLIGVEAVIDKDLCSELLARELRADLLVMATDAEAVCIDWGKPLQKAIHRVRPDDLEQFSFPAGSMGPKVEAASHFARTSGKTAAIGSLADIAGMVRGDRGTIINTGFAGLTWHG